MKPEAQDDEVELPVYRVLKPGAGRADFLHAAQAMGLVHHKSYQPASAHEPYEEVWSTADKTVAVHYVDDPISGTKYVTVRGEDTRDTLAALLLRIQCFWPEELVYKVVDAESFDDIVPDLFRLAVTFPEYEERVFQILSRTATRAPHAVLRAAAVNAMAYRGWPESRPVVESVAKDDPDAEVRREAQKVLPLWDPAVRHPSGR